jgi:hypothetical protein
VSNGTGQCLAMMLQISIYQPFSFFGLVWFPDVSPLERYIVQKSQFMHLYVCKRDKQEGEEILFHYCKIDVYR